MAKNIGAHLEKKLALLPKRSGVYRFIDEDGRLLYIGKAKVLTDRVRSYFQKNEQHTPKTILLVSKIFDIEWTETSNEAEALVLESNLVHTLLPPFNILLRDDKNFLYLKIPNELFPVVSFVRQRKKDGATYFGPFPTAKNVRKTLALARELLRFQTCRVRVGEHTKILANPEKRSLPCLDFQIHRCSAPCAGKISPEQYAEDISVLKDFFRGKSVPLQRRARDEMRCAAEEKEFEKAARFRDLLGVMMAFDHKQIATVPTNFSADILAFFSGVEKSFFHVLGVREGKIIRSDGFFTENAESPRETFLAFFRDYIRLSAETPPLFLLPEIFPMEEKNLWREAIALQKEKFVEIRRPQRGNGRALMELAEKNAAVAAANSRASFEKNDVLDRLQKALSLSHRPERIECYDISHLSGTHTVGSRVVFCGGKAKKSEYRRYKIHDLKAGKIDDFASMAEVLGRRLKRLQNDTSLLSLKEVTKKEDIAKIEEEMRLEKLPTFRVPERQFQFLEKESGTVVGFARLKRRGKLLEVGGILVRSHFRGRGMGLEIMKTLVADSSEKVLRAITKKRTALRWLLALKSIGFVEEKKIPKSFVGIIAERIEKDGHERVSLKISPKDLRNAMKKIPDLLVIDGGKGQLSAVVSVLQKMNLHIPVCALAKREEEIFMPHQRAALSIPKTAPENELLQNIRDEAHRFAISFHRSLRQKSLTHSVLDEVLGLSPDMRTALLRQFGSADAVFAATDEELRKHVSAKVLKAIQKKKVEWKEKSSNIR